MGEGPGGGLAAERPQCAAPRRRSKRERSSNPLFIIGYLRAISGRPADYLASSRCGCRLFGDISPPPLPLSIVPLRSSRRAYPSRVSTSESFCRPAVVRCCRSTGASFFLCSLVLSVYSHSSWLMCRRSEAVSVPSSRSTRDFPST